MTTLLDTPPAAHTLWPQMIEDLPREHGFEALRVEGRLPADLIGTVYRNGPALNEGLGLSYRHHFDGDGAISAVRFAGDGAALGAARLVETPELVAERKAGRRLYGTFGTPAPSLWRRLGARVKNSANTNVMAWGGRLFAQFEASQPVELEPSDLSTLGPSDLDGVLRGAFSAHHHAVAARGAIYNFGLRLGPRSSLDLYELAPKNARHLGSVPLAGSPMVHDFVATEKHLVFLIGPVHLRAWRQFFGLGTPLTNFEWRPDEGAEVLVVPIDDPSQVTRFRVDPCYVWHFSNAYEEGDQIVVDYVRFEDFSTIDLLRRDYAREPQPGAAGTLHRARLDPRQQTFRSEPVWDVSCEFPKVPERFEGAACHRAFLASHSEEARAAGAPLDEIARVDLRTGAAQTCSFGTDTYPSEPLLARGEGKGEGYVLSLVYDARAHLSYLAVVDADRVEDGAIAKVWFDQHIPLGFHGTWVAGR